MADVGNEVAILWRGELLLGEVLSGTRHHWTLEDMDALAQLLETIRKIRFDKVRRQDQHRRAKVKRRAAGRIRATK